MPMNTLRWRIVVIFVLVLLVGLIIRTSPSETLAGYPVSEHYQLTVVEVRGALEEKIPGYQMSVEGSEQYHLVSSGIGDVPQVMGSDSYTINEGVVLQAEIALPMESEHYRSGGEVLRIVYLPMVLSSSE
jgi:hypothetical protein